MNLAVRENTGTIVKNDENGSQMQQNSGGRINFE